MTDRIHWLEKDQRLSDSKLWTLLEKFYQQSGLDAWLQLPFYATSNAFIADLYAELVLAFLQDLFPHSPPEEPVYLLELAAGSGYFSYLCLQALVRKSCSFPHLQQAWVYVMTDFSAKNLQAWENSPQLTPFVQQGRLDFALFQPEVQAKLKLKVSGQVLKAGRLQNPILVFANYFFDSIRQDYFQIAHGELSEASISLAHTPSAEAPKAPPRFDQLELKDRYLPVQRPRFADPRLNVLLESYLNEGPELSLLFPSGALRVLQQLEKLSPAGWMLISTDKGFHDRAYLQGLRPVPFTPHSGVFSYMVNYHTLGRYLEQTGGLSFGSQEHYALTTWVGIAPLATGMALQQTRFVLQEKLQRQNPIKNLFVLLDLFKRKDLLAAWEVQERYLMAMAAIQAACFDVYYFMVLAPYLAQGLAEIGIDYLEDDLPGLLRKVEAQLYDAVAGFDAAYEWLRHLYYEAGLLEDSLRLNARILARTGPDFKTAYYAAAVDELRGQWAQALQGYTQALIYNAQDEMAQAGLKRVVEQLGS